MLCHTSVCSHVLFSTQTLVAHREGELRKARPPTSTGSVMLDMMNKMGKMNLNAGIPNVSAKA